LQKDSDQFWCLSVLLVSEHRQLFPGIRLPGREANQWAILRHVPSWTVTDNFTLLYEDAVSRNAISCTSS